MERSRYTFVTVVFEQEYELLLLQARSMRIFCDRGLLDKVIVIDNSSGGLPQRWKKKFLNEYGDISRVLQILRSQDFVNLPPSKGWTSQQILKLAIARAIPTDRYVVLDAKNHLIAPLTTDDLETPDGRARACPRMAYGPTHPLRPHLERTLAYFGLEQEVHHASFTGATTPYTMHTEVVRQLIGDIEKEERASFEQSFIKYRLTEFFSYASHIIKRGIEIETLYDFGGAPALCLWEDAANLKGCRAVIAEAQRGKSPFFATHRAALQKLRADARGELAAFWASRSLFDSKETASRFLLWLRVKLILHAWTKPIRTLRQSFNKRLKRILNLPYLTGNSIFGRKYLGQ